MPKIITDETLEIAADAYRKYALDADTLLSYAGLRAALEAALPMLGEAIAKEIEREADNNYDDVDHATSAGAGLYDGAKTVRTLTAEKVTETAPEKGRASLAEPGKARW